MKLLKSLCISITTYSALPAPNVEWNSENKKYALVFLPVVGAIVGAALWAWSWLCGYFGVAHILFAAGAAALPLLITGGIHMDGFMDTTDAIRSYQSTERKLEIMDDPHVGAFAVMWCALYLIATFALFAAPGNVAVVCVGYVLSRSVGAVSVLTLPLAKGGGMLKGFADSAGVKAAVLCIIAALCVAAMVLLGLWAGVFAAAAVGLVFLRYVFMVKKHFGGATGDTAGWLIMSCELWILIGARIGGLI